MEALRIEKTPGFSCLIFFGFFIRKFREVVIRRDTFFTT